jgi:hypothetical protein
MRVCFVVAALLLLTTGCAPLQAVHVAPVATQDPPLPLVITEEYEAPQPCSSIWLRVTNGDYCVLYL